MKKYILIIFVFLAITIIIFKHSFNDISYIEKENININDYYYDSVIANADGNIFSINDNNYIKIGEYKKGNILNLDKVVGEYFRIKGTEYFIHYKTVNEYKENISERYKKYINIGKNINTKNNFKLYKDENIFLLLNAQMSFEVIFIDNNKYYVIFNNNLYYILKDDINTVIDLENYSNYAKEIPVLNYHFIYDKKYETCNELICIEKNLFEEHLKYLNDNNFLTLTMNEFNLWMDGTLKIPEKSVLITFDDGALGTDTHLIELLEKYNMNASLFLITAWWPKSKYISPNLEIYSHGYDIHLDNYCAKGPRGLCLTKVELLQDLSQSITLVDSNLAFCYPFYEYNNTMLDALTELDFKLAFIGGNKKAKKTDNKLLLPRYVIHKNTSLNSFKQIVN